MARRTRNRTPLSYVGPDTERDAARVRRNVARHRTVTMAAAKSPTTAMLDTALEGGRLARTDGGESDELRGAGVLAADTATGRRLRLAGWVVAPDAADALGADQVHALMVAAGLVPASATIDDTIGEYARLAVLADRETSATAERDQLAAEAAWWADREAAEVGRDQVRAVLAAWLARLMHGPKFEYAARLVDAWETGGELPAPPAGTVWGPKCRARFEYLLRHAEGVAA